MASQIAILMISYSTVDSGTDQRKHQSSASLAFVREIHRWPVNVSIWWRHHRLIKSGISKLLNLNTGPLCGEFTGHRWIPLTKACDAELWYFLWSALELSATGDLWRHRAHYDVIVIHQDSGNAPSEKIRWTLSIDIFATDNIRQQASIWHWGSAKYAVLCHYAYKWFTIKTKGYKYIVENINQAYPLLQRK